MKTLEITYMDGTKYSITFTKNDFIKLMQYFNYDIEHVYNYSTLFKNDIYIDEDLNIAKSVISNLNKKYSDKVIEFSKIKSNNDNKSYDKYFNEVKRLFNKRQKFENINLERLDVGVNYNMEMYVR